MNLYTYILEFRGGTYIAQVYAHTIEKSVPKWIEKLKSKQCIVPFLGLKSISTIENNINSEKIIKINGSQNIWCFAFQIKQGFGLVHIVKTCNQTTAENTRIISYKHWILAVDYNRTKEVYNQRKTGSAKSCNCIHCKNFSANRDRIFPEKFKKFLAQLGIDYTKEAEVYHMGETENNRHFYGGWFHVKGKTVNKNISIATNTDNTIVINKDFQFKIIQNSSLSFFSKEEHNNLIQIEFFAYSDWVVDKEHLK